MKVSIAFVTCVVICLLAGCGTKSSEAEPNIDGRPYLLSSEPDGAKGVVETLDSAKDDDEIVVVGRIGGQADPWIKRRAAFFIVDEALTPCNEIEGDKCKVPWDYCCEPDLGKSRTLVKIVDDSGELVPVSAQKLVKVKELQTVVVKGQAKRDDDGNLTVFATGLFVKSK